MIRSHMLWISDATIVGMGGESFGPRAPRTIRRKFCTCVGMLVGRSQLVDQLLRQRGVVFLYSVRYSTRVTSHLSVPALVFSNSPKKIATLPSIMVGLCVGGVG
jgi:hypothetical protein